MAISTLDGYISAAKQKVQITKTQTATTVAAQWHTLLDRAGSPGAGSLSVGNTANGLVPTDSLSGAPDINAFGGGATGYIGAVEFSSTVACRMYLYDRLFHAGSFACSTLQTFTLASQPSYSSRVPGGSDYTGLEIWVEVNAAMAASATTIAVGYTNQANTSGRTTPASASLSGFIAGRLVQLPLQASDTGVRQINSVVVGGATNASGTVNVFVARPIWQGRVRSANDGDVHGIDKTGMPVVFADSCLCLAVAADSTSSGIPDVLFDVVNG